MVTALQPAPSGHRARDLLLASLGVLAAVAVIVPTAVTLALTGGHDDPAPVVRLPASAPPVARPGPSSAARPSSPVAAAQAQLDALVTRFANSIDPQERARLLPQIRRLASTPGVHVPDR